MESIGTDIFYSYDLNDSSYCPAVKEMESLLKINVLGQGSRKN